MSESTKREEPIRGEAFLAFGGVVLMTDKLTYTLSDEVLCGQIVSILRHVGITDHTRSEAKVDIEIKAVEVIEREFIPEGLGYLAHHDRTVKYEVPLMFLSKTWGDKSKSFIAGRDACSELAACEQLRGEF